MKRSVKFTGLLMMFMLCMSYAEAQVRVFVNVTPVVPACRPNVVVVPAPRPARVVYVPVNGCHNNCHVHHTHVYNHHHGHVNHGANYNNHKHHYNHNNGHKSPGHGNNQNYGNKGNNGSSNGRRR